ncbi:neurotrypsin isoform X1 [Tachysurus fulvidraco]|uniref:neurotrypsin isoform X1 n=1 Tax=Tachysurus fulvidraco TaxID=1234273 RepID=UPI001FEE37DA|nr:neurotrypsin isoform X1 [Tachysurus fulvidraco]
MEASARCSSSACLPLFFLLLLCVAPTSSFLNPFSECTQSRGRGASYRGSVDVTESGARCMNWSEVSGVTARYPGKGLGEHNFCRNPDARIRPWCFFLNARGRVDWGYCDCKQGSVRLQGGRSKLDGTVEVYMNGVWGTICSNDWDDRDAHVVCRQLGLGFKARARVSSLSRLPLAVVHWRTIRCSGGEVDLLQCPRSVWNGGECANQQAAAVTCTPVEAVSFVPVRLSGGATAYEGRVEVYHAGQWGTVCDDQWDNNDAEVVCRQLSLGGTAKAWVGAYFGAGVGRVLLDEVSCTGNELSIEQCPKTAWGEHNCDHSEDAGVSCTPLTDGSVRLVGGAGGFEGRLEVHYHGRWGTVCDDGWTNTNTQVVCRQLGYRSGQSANPERFGVPLGPILLDDVSCTGKEPTLTHCARKEWLRHDCKHTEDVAVVCSSQRVGHGVPTSVPVRLVGGENESEGRVEILLAGQWGTICDDGWTDEDAEVVCRQLGYSGEAKARVMAYFGEGRGPIHVDSMKCTGAERSLADCIKQPIGSHNCRHSEDAGVICNYGQRDNSTRIKDVASSVCGLRPTHTRRKRIIGGQNSLRGGWPWQVAVRLRGSQSDGRLVCGATLISSCWVLTSAHCFKRYGNGTSTYKVRVGDYHTLVPEEHEDEYAVDKIVLHPRYHPQGNDYDLALVRLMRHGGHRGHSGECVRQSYAVLPVCLPGWRERAPKDLTKCYITGWGDTGRAYSKTLQQASITVLSKRHCERHYGNQLTSRMLCAGSALSGRHVDSCRGDSGGPLVCERGASWIVYGVTSWGHACRLQDSPGVYTKVSAFLPWITKVTNQ